MFPSVQGREEICVLQGAFSRLDESLMHTLSSEPSLESRQHTRQAVTNTVEPRYLGKVYNRNVSITNDLEMSLPI